MILGTSLSTPLIFRSPSHIVLFFAMIPDTSHNVYYLTWLVARVVLYTEKRTAEVGATSLDD